jgi:hypothetical protein
MLITAYARGGEERPTSGGQRHAHLRQLRKRLQRLQHEELAHKGGSSGPPRIESSRAQRGRGGGGAWNAAWGVDVRSERTGACAPDAGVAGARACGGSSASSGDAPRSARRSSGARAAWAHATAGAERETCPSTKAARRAPSASMRSPGGTCGAGGTAAGGSSESAPSGGAGCSAWKRSSRLASSRGTCPRPPSAPAACWPLPPAFRARWLRRRCPGQPDACSMAQRTLERVPRTAKAPRRGRRGHLGIHLAHLQQRGRRRHTHRRLLCPPAPAAGATGAAGAAGDALRDAPQRRGTGGWRRCAGRAGSVLAPCEQINHGPN